MAYNNASLAMYLVSPDRTRRYRIYCRLASSFAHGEHEIGAASVTLPENAPCIEAAFSDSTPFDYWSKVYHWSLDLYYLPKSTSTPVWSGPLMRVEFGNDGFPTVTLQAEAWLGHWLKRGANYTSTSAVDTLNTYPDNIIRTAQRNVWGASPTTPTGYPVTRADSGPYWTVSGSSNVGSPSSSTLQHTEQSDSNLEEFCVHIARKGDIALTIDETSAAVFKLSTEYPYQDTDRTAASEGPVVLSAATGTVVGFTAERTWLKLANIWKGKGAGSGATQKILWDSDSTSITAYGNFESAKPLPGAGGGSVNELSAELAQLKADGADSQQTFGIELSGVGSYTLFDDFDRRDLVYWHDPHFNQSGTALVRGWSLSESTSGWSAKPVLGDITPSLSRDVARFVGLRGTLSNGDRFRDTSSN